MHAPDPAPPPPGAPPAPSARASGAVLLIVFATILIDFVGFTVLIPVLPLYAEELGASDFQVASILTVYALAQLLFLPLWGWISDRIGRRPVILVSLLGTVASFLLLAVAESIATIYWARILAGFFAASIGTAQAVVTDVTAPSERARGMGLIGAAFGAGMVVGPVLGGLSAGIDARAPFYLISALALLNFVVACFALPESLAPERRETRWTGLGATLVPTPLRLFGLVHEKRIGLYLYLFFHIFSAFAVLEALITLYAGKTFGRAPLDIGWLFMWIGLVMIATQGVVLRRLVHHYGEARLVVTGLLAMGGGLAALAFAPSFAWFYPIGALVAFGNGVTFPAFTSLYSKACREGQAGELLGQGQAMSTTGRIVGPLLGGWIMSRWGPAAPFLAAGALMGLALALFWNFRALLVDGDAD